MEVGVWDIWGDLIGLDGIKLDCPIDPASWGEGRKQTTRPRARDRHIHHTLSPQRAQESSPSGAFPFDIIRQQQQQPSSSRPLLNVIKHNVGANARRLPRTGLQPLVIAGESYISRTSHSSLTRKVPQLRLVFHSNRPPRTLIVLHLLFFLTLQLDPSRTRRSPPIDGQEG